MLHGEPSLLSVSLRDDKGLKTCIFTRPLGQHLSPLLFGAGSSGKPICTHRTSASFPLHSQDYLKLWKLPRHHLPTSLPAFSLLKPASLALQHYIWNKYLMVIFLEGGGKNIDKSLFPSHPDLLWGRFLGSVSVFFLSSASPVLVIQLYQRVQEWQEILPKAYRYKTMDSQCCYVVLSKNK